MRSIKSLFGSALSSAIPNDVLAIARNEMEVLDKFASKSDLFASRLTKWFTDAEDIHRDFRESLSMLFDGDCPHRPTILSMVDILTIFHTTHHKLKGEVSQVRIATAEMIKKTRVVTAQLRSRDTAYQRLEHYEKKVDRLRTQATTKTTDRLIRNEQKLEDSVKNFREQDATSRLELHTALTTQFQEASLLVKKLLAVSVQFLWATSAQMNRMLPYLDQLQEITFSRATPPLSPMAKPPPLMTAMTPTTNQNIVGAGRTHTNAASASSVLFTRNGSYAPHSDTGGHTPAQTDVMSSEKPCSQVIDRKADRWEPSPTFPDPFASSPSTQCDSSFPNTSTSQPSDTLPQSLYGTHQQSQYSESPAPPLKALPAPVFPENMTKTAPGMAEMRHSASLAAASRNSVGPIGPFCLPPTGHSSDFPPYPGFEPERPASSGRWQQGEVYNGNAAHCNRDKSVEGNVVLQPYSDPAPSSLKVQLKGVSQSSSSAPLQPESRSSPALSAQGSTQKSGSGRYSGGVPPPPPPGTARKVKGRGSDGLEKPKKEKSMRRKGCNELWANFGPEP